MSSTDVPRRGVRLCLLEPSVELVLILLLTHELQVFVPHNLLLTISYLLLLGLILLSTLLISLDELLIGNLFIPALVVSDLVLLINEHLRGITQISLLVAMDVKMLLILKTFVGHSSKHRVPLTQPVTSLHILGILLLFHRLLKLVTVLACQSSFMNRLTLLISSICLGLTLDDGTPLI